MSRDEAGFLDVVAEYEQFANDVDLTRKASEIGVGEYTVALTKFHMDKVIARDVETGVAKITMEILVGEKEGESFTDSFWFPRGPGGTIYAHRGLLVLARCVCERNIKTLSEAVEVLKAATESKDSIAVLQVSITATKGKENRTYFNILYNGRVDSDE